MKILDLYSKFSAFCGYVQSKYQIPWAQAQDIVQKAFIVAERAYNDQEFLEPVAEALLIKIIKSTAIKERRTEAAEKRRIQAYEAKNSFSVDLNVEWLLALCAPQFRQILREFYLEGYTYTDLSKKYRKPRNTVKGWVHRGKKSVQKALQKLGNLIELKKDDLKSKRGLPEVEDGE